MNPEKVLAADMSISDKIRALDAAGYERADIARMIDRRYQHVRNVLEGDKLRSKSRRRPARPYGHTLSASAIPGHGLRMTVADDLSIALSSDVLDALGVGPGETLVGQLEGDRLVLMSSRTALERAQAMVRTLVPEGTSLADELIEDRRRDSALE